MMLVQPASVPLCGNCVRPPGNLSESTSVTIERVHQQRCPTWFFWNKDSHESECGPKHRNLICDRIQNQTRLNFPKCMTYDNGTNSTTVAGCPFGSIQTDHLITLPQNRSQLNEEMCGKANREGLLCSRCKPGYGPAVLSYGHSCAKCSEGYSGWLLYICLALIPTTVFFLIIVLCQVRTTSAPMYFIVFLCQLFSYSILVYPHEVKTTTLYGMAVTLFTAWNLDFFRLLMPPFCVSESLSNLQVLCMDYIVAFYPLLLTVVLYVCIQQYARGCRFLVWLWMPFAYCLSPVVRRFNWNPAASAVPVFASFLLLSSSKILCVSASLLQRVHLTTVSDTGDIQKINNALYYDPNLTFFGQSHLPYAILAIFVSTTFVILPCLLLMLYPIRVFQKFLNFFGLSRPAVHAFADAFNGCYKNGTNGTRDCRSFASFYLLARILALMTFTGETSPISKNLFVILGLFIFSTASPNKSRLLNLFESYGLTVLACRVCIAQYRDIFNAIFFVSATLYPLALICRKLALSLNCCCCQRLKAVTDWMPGVGDTQPMEREVGDEEENLPDRLVNPNEYRLLSATEAIEVKYTSTIPTYGSTQFTYNNNIL